MNNTPRWFTAIDLLCALPVFQFPVLLANAPEGEGARIMVWLYPFYVLMAAYLAWQCYSERRALAWILLVLMVMSHVAIWILVMNENNLTL